jgi:hypothetical protein
MRAIDRIARMAGSYGLKTNFTVICFEKQLLFAGPGKGDAA